MKFDLIFGQYFFLSNTVINQSREVRDYLVLFAEFGGFKALFYSLIIFLLNNMSDKKMFSRFMKRLYFSSDIGRVKFSITDVFCNKKKKKQFERGKKKVIQQLDVCHILIQIQKIKAVLSALVQNDISLIKSARKFFIECNDFENDTIIFNRFDKFMNDSTLEELIRYNTQDTVLNSSFAADEETFDISQENLQPRFNKRNLRKK